MSGTGVKLDNVLKQFRNFDADGSGTIETIELTNVLQTLDPDTWSAARVKSLLQVIDQNSDGIIQFEEFIHWAFNSFKELEFREDIHLNKPRMTWKFFQVMVTDNGIIKYFDKVHPSHKAFEFFHRLSVAFLQPAREMILCFENKQISYGAVGTDALADFGFDQFCAKDAVIPPMYIKEHLCMEAQILEALAAREESDKKLCDPETGIWYGKKINELRRCATYLDEPSFECKIVLLQKQSPKQVKPSFGSEDAPETPYPQLIFYIGDWQNPPTVYGKHTYELTGKRPREEKGYPREKWFNAPAVHGVLESDEVQKQLEELRSEAKDEAGKLKRDAPANDEAKIEHADKKMQEAYKPVKLTPYSKEEKEIIQECVVPFVTRIWHKIYKHPDIEDDGFYVSNIEKDGFELGPPQPLEPETGSREKRWTNSIFIHQDNLRLRIFKALGLLSKDADETPWPAEEKPGEDNTAGR